MTFSHGTKLGCWTRVGRTASPPSSPSTARTTDAIPLWRLTAKLEPGYIPARVRLGDALLNDNQPGEAARAYDAYRLALLAGTASISGDPKTGIRLIERAVALTPANPYYHYPAGALQAIEESFLEKFDHPAR